MDNVQNAVTRFEGWNNCAQAILTSFCEKDGLDREIALKLTTGFGGGMASMGNTCGAVTGAFMVIGLKHGRILEEEIEEKEKTKEIILEFVKRFKEKYTSIMCRDLIGCDLSTEEGQEKAENEDLYNKICKNLVGDAAAILTGLL